MENGFFIDSDFPDLFLALTVKCSFFRKDRRWKTLLLNCLFVLSLCYYWFKYLFYAVGISLAYTEQFRVFSIKKII